MAMTKAEQARMAALQKAVDEAKALSWPSYGEPQMIPPPKGGHTEGFVIYPYRAVSGSALSAVEAAWSESVSHGSGQHTTSRGRSASQQGIALYATREDALKGLRLSLTRMFAEKLAVVDKAIAEASDAA